MLTKRSNFLLNEAPPPGFREAYRLLNWPVIVYARPPLHLPLRWGVYGLRWVRGWLLVLRYYLGLNP